MSKNLFANIILLSIIIILIGLVSYLIFSNQDKSAPIPHPTPQTMTVSLGQQFSLKKNQFAKIAGTELEVGVVEFYNNPCKSECFWSGVGVGFEYHFNGQIKKGIDLVQVFDYKTTIVKTDHETYANIIVEKIK